MAASPHSRRVVLLLAAILVADALWALLQGSTGTLAYGLVDEPAHLATCVIALLAGAAALRTQLSLPFVVAALVASVAIDVDHLPGYLGTQLITGQLPRPYTHSLAPVAALLALGVVLRRPEQRQIAFGVACGVSAHLLRDMATGPGAPLLWPLLGSALTVPYVLYAAVLSAAVGVVALSRRRGPERRRHRRRLVARPLPRVGPQGGS